MLHGLPILASIVADTDTGIVCRLSEHLGHRVKELRHINCKILIFNKMANKGTSSNLLLLALHANIAGKMSASRWWRRQQLLLIVVGLP